MRRCVQNENIPTLGYNQGHAKSLDCMKNSQRKPLGVLRESIVPFRAAEPVLDETMSEDDEDMILAMEDSVYDMDHVPTEPWINIDGEENGESWQYRRPVFAYLRAVEGRHFPDPNYMFTAQTEITQRMRAILVDWLNEVASEYHLKRETLHLSINYLDRFLSRTRVSRDRLQLVGVTCILIASKYCEISPPSADDFVFITDSAYSKREVLAMEHIVLNTLSFELTAVTPLDFLSRFLQSAAAHSHPTVVHLSQYLCELSLQNYTFVGVSPSKIAACAVCLALHTVGLPAWSPAMQHYTGYDGPELIPVMSQMLRDFAAAPNGPLTAVYDKYGQHLFRRVSSLPPPTSIPRLIPTLHLVH